MSHPRFGEHQARYWLDAVRYGDTHGLHLDNRRGIYPYRDWVVRAFNENLPLDQFIQWQLAGDLLPEPTIEQRLATGFVRLNPSTGEGGAIAEEFQMKNNFDRVETVGTVFLGLSLTCARCHTHKYDPIEQTEYYRLLAFFNSTAEPSLDGNSYTYGPVVEVPADQAAWDRWRQLEASANDWLSRWREEQSFDTAAALDYAKKTSSWAMKDWRISEPVSLDQPEAQPNVPTRKWSAVSGFPGSISGRAAKGRLPGEAQVVWVSVQVSVPVPQSLDISFAGAKGSRLYVDGDQAKTTEKQPASDESTIVVELSPGMHELQFAIHGAPDLQSLSIQIASRWDCLAEKQNWKACSSAERLRMLADANGPLGAGRTSPDHDALAEEAERLADAMLREQAAFTTSMVAQEMPTRRATYLLRRGEYDAPMGDPLEPKTPDVLGGWSSELPGNRLGLAQWITAPENPLVARVLVNRIWQQIFGHAIVRTPEEFGVQGQQPTHPELLDWLAVELHESGWDLKHIIRSMVLSRTFRQSSQWRAEIDDPENRWFARASSYRLDAEVLRDVGQPAGMWAALAHPASNTKKYEPDHGRRLYRRSLYVYWKRTSPHPMMTLFDAPDRESSCVRRSRTNTPLQSLGMLNETQRIEMGRALAIRLLQDEQQDRRRIDRLVRMLTCRDPSPKELSACESLLASLRARYRESPEDAKRLLAIGEAPGNESMDPEELAAWAQLATTVLASDIAIMMY
jgi:hypothetical protein